MRILHVASEAYPLVKTGGLADVAGALPAAQRQLGLDARLLIPAYPDAIRRLEPEGTPIELGELLIGTGTTRLLSGRMPRSGVPVWLLECPSLYHRPGGLYQDARGQVWSDNHLRFGLLGRAAARLAEPDAPAGWRCDLVHAHDWHAGLAPAYLALRPGPRPATVMTVHNIAFPGKFALAAAVPLGLPPACVQPEGVEFYGSLSFLKAGLHYADRITTVSPTYAREIQTLEGGMGFDGLLRKRSAHLRGILNGIDEDLWDPARDPLLAAPFDAHRIEEKAPNKTALQRRLGLSESPRTFLAGVVGRLTEQKGIDLVVRALPSLLELGAQVAVLGSGDRVLERALTRAARRYPGRVAVRIGYDESEAHRFQAGCDLFLMPSRFEPCGLTQMQAMRYGAPPLAHRTGGLADTVVDVSERGRGTGFLFEESSVEALMAAFRRARERYQARKAWRSLQRRCMVQRFGWEVSARRYQELYQELTLS
jgi:starch synthase